MGSTNPREANRVHESRCSQNPANKTAVVSTSTTNPNTCTTIVPTCKACGYQPRFGSKYDECMSKHRRRGCPGARHKQVSRSGKKQTQLRLSVQPEMVCVYLCVCMLNCPSVSLSLYLCVYACTYVYVCVYSSNRLSCGCPYSRKWSVCICVCACLTVRLCLCLFIYVCMHVLMCMCVCIHRLGCRRSCDNPDTD